VQLQAYRFFPVVFDKLCLLLYDSLDLCLSVGVIHTKVTAEAAVTCILLSI